MTVVKEIMETNVLTIRDDVPVIDVARFLRDKGINGAPVVNDVGRMVGILSQSDLIKLTKVAAEAEKDEEREAERYDGAGPSKPPGFLEQLVSPLLIAKWGRQVARLDRDAEESELLRTKTAADIMTRQVVTVGLDEPIKKVVELMTSKGINRIPVIDERGELAGMVTRADIVEALAEQFKEGK